MGGGTGISVKQHLLASEQAAKILVNKSTSKSQIGVLHSPLSGERQRGRKEGRRSQQKPAESTAFPQVNEASKLYSVHSVAQPPLPSFLPETSTHRPSDCCFGKIPEFQGRRRCTVERFCDSNLNVSFVCVSSVALSPPLSVKEETAHFIFSGCTAPSCILPVQVERRPWLTSDWKILNFFLILSLLKDCNLLTVGILSTLLLCCSQPACSC